MRHTSGTLRLTAQQHQRIGDIKINKHSSQNLSWAQATQRHCEKSRDLPKYTTAGEQRVKARPFTVHI
jgi:hypothetical protein